MTKQWTAEEANAWYKKQPYLTGANYIPANAINQLEMWQAETFDPARIDLELGWAENIGMNTMRVFLHDLLWEHDREGFKNRIDTFLTLCEKHKIKPMIVLFDSVWDPLPKLGKQRDPVPGVHNSGWVQSPGATALKDTSQYPRLQEFVEGVIGAYANDPRVLAWDVWNEPDNTNDANYGPLGLNQELADKNKFVLALLPKVFEWARNANPQQPLTSGVWRGDWSVHDKMDPIFKVQLEQSDIISFHNYDPPAIFEQRIHELSRYNRPMFCTEYMARGLGNTFEAILPLAKKFNVATLNWGFVEGKTQTNMPWDSWQKPYTNGHSPAVWFHDIFHGDGKPYIPEEIKLFKPQP